VKGGGTREAGILTCMPSTEMVNVWGQTMRGSSVTEAVGESPMVEVSWEGVR